VHLFHSILPIKIYCTLLYCIIIVQDGMTHWERNITTVVQPPVSDNLWRCPVQQDPSVNIELTAYALLIYARVKGITESWPIAKWLISQRNSNGGFSSTQVSHLFMFYSYRFLDIFRQLCIWCINEDLHRFKPVVCVYS